MPAFGRVILAVCFTLVLVAMRSQGARAANWYNSSWTYRKKIIIDTSKIAGSATSFPVLISRTDPNWKFTSFGGHVGSATGWDFIVTDADGTTKLDHEIEKYASSTGEFVSWARLPFLSSTTAHVLYLYYGNSAASDQQNAANTWNTSFKGVYHFGNGVTLSVNDSTSNAHNGTNHNVTATTGELAGGASFDGSTKYIDLGTTSNFNFAGTQPYTISLWLNAASLGAFAAISRYNNGVEGSWFIDTNGSVIRIDREISPFVLLANTTLSTNTWYLVHYVYDGTNVSIYLNGRSDVTPAPFGSIAANTVNALIGAGLTSGSPSNYFAGTLDEVRLSTEARSAAWIQTEYNNQSVPSAFYGFDPEEPLHGVQVSSRSDILSDSRPSATSNHTVAFTYKYRLECDGGSARRALDHESFFSGNLHDFRRRHLRRLGQHPRLHQFRGNRAGSSGGELGIHGLERESGQLHCR